VRASKKQKRRDKKCRRERDVENFLFYFFVHDFSGKNFLSLKKAMTMVEETLCFSSEKTFLSLTL
jgi:hypothetical protein